MQHYWSSRKKSRIPRSGGRSKAPLTPHGVVCSLSLALWPTSLYLTFYDFTRGLHITCPPPLPLRSRLFDIFKYRGKWGTTRECHWHYWRAEKEILSGIYMQRFQLQIGKTTRPCETRQSPGIKRAARHKAGIHSLSFVPPRQDHAPASPLSVPKDFSPCAAAADSAVRNKWYLSR